MMQKITQRCKIILLQADFINIVIFFTDVLSEIRFVRSQLIKLVEALMEEREGQSLFTSQITLISHKEPFNTVTIFQI